MRCSKARLISRYGEERSPASGVLKAPASGGDPRENQRLLARAAPRPDAELQHHAGADLHRRPRPIEAYRMSPSVVKASSPGSPGATAASADRPVDLRSLPASPGECHAGRRRLGRRCPSDRREADRRHQGSSHQIFASSNRNRFCRRWERHRGSRRSPADEERAQPEDQPALPHQLGQREQAGNQQQ